MIIHEPKKSIIGDRVRISAFIESEKRPGLSDTLWFEFPADLAAGVSGQTGAFLSAMLPVAMVYGEPLTVRGRVSPKLVAGIGTVQPIFHGWSPSTYKMIDIRCDELEAERVSGVEPAPAAAFSGGIDSFFTFISHLPGSTDDPGRRLKYVLFVHGFDIPLDDRKNYDLARESYEKMAAAAGVRLIPAATNFRSLRLTGSVIWDIACGPVLFGTALSLAPALSRFFVPSAHRHAEHLAQSTNPLVDHNFSTETTQFVHDGAEFSRCQKTRVVAGFQPSYGNLRVCWVKPDGLNNCGRCQKCLRTMVTLDLLGVLPRYTTFSLPLPKRLDKWVMTSESDIIFVEDIRELAVERGATRLAGQIGLAIKRSRRTIALAERISRMLGLRGYWLADRAICYGLFLFHGPAAWTEIIMRLWPRLLSGGDGVKTWKRVRPVV